MKHLEPKNSWEVSYIIAIKKPHIQTGVSFQQLARLLSRERTEELRSWASEYYDHRWFKEHI